MERLELTATAAYLANGILLVQEQPLGLRRGERDVGGRNDHRSRLAHQVDLAGLLNGVPDRRRLLAWAGMCENGFDADRPPEERAVLMSDICRHISYQTPYLSKRCRLPVAASIIRSRPVVSAGASSYGTKLVKVVSARRNERGSPPRWWS